MEKNIPGFTYKMLSCELTVTQGVISVRQHHVSIRSLPDSSLEANEISRIIPNKMENMVMHSAALVPELDHDACPSPAAHNMELEMLRNVQQG